MARTLVRLLVLSVLILAVFSFPQMIQHAQAALTGKVCIAPDLPTVTACPASPVALTGPVTSGPSTQIRLQVFIQGTDPMNGFDVTLLADHTVLVPAGIDFTGTILGTPVPSPLLECLQGVLVAGPVCQASDTIDTLHLAAIASIGALPGGLTSAGASGLLFTAIYKVVAASPGVTIGFQTDANDKLTNCATSSVPGTCISISNGTTLPVAETAQTGTFSSTTTQPFLQLSAPATSLGIAFPGTPIPAQTITTTDNNGYGPWQENGGIAPGDTTIFYVVTVTPPTTSATGITATLGAPNPQDFVTSTGAGFSVQNSLSFTNAATTTSGVWTIAVTGTYHFDPNCVVGVGCPGPASTLAETLTITMSIEDFGFTVNGSTSLTFVPFWCPAASQGSACPGGQSGIANLAVTSKGYTGAVTLTNGTPSPGTSPALTTSLSANSIAGASGTATDTFAGGLLRPTTALGSYSLSVTSSGALTPNGVFASQTKTHAVTVLVRPQDFNVTIVSGNPASFNSGSSTTGSISIGSLPSGVAAGVNAAGFAGPVTLSSTITGGTGLSVAFATNPVSLTAGQKVSDVVTFSGSVASTTTFTVVITGTASLSSSSPTTQTHSVTFSVMVTGTTHPTSTSVICVPSPVATGSGTSCTATVTDISPSGATTPTGTVTFASSGTGTFTPSNSCSLIAGATGTASCSVTYTPSVVGTGTHTITANYGGDSSHGTSSNTFALTVTQAVATVSISTTLSQTSITVGGSVTDGATLSGNTATAGGTVTYSFFTGSTCGGTGAVVGTPATVTNGVVPNSASQAFNTAGSFSWNAAYSGDSANSQATSPCEPLTVNKASPSLATSLVSNPISVGGSTTDSATLTGGFQAGGTVTYSFFAGSSCGGSGTAVGSPVTVTGGVVPNSGSQTFNSAGSFSWNAVYSGDGNNNGATSTCEPLTVNPASGAIITTTLSSTSITVGGSVSDSVSLTGVTSTAGGTVTYNFFAGSSCTGTATPVGSPVTVTNGVVPGSASHTFNSAGSFSWNAVYSGDANNAGATSACEPLAVNKASPTIATSLLINPINVGGSVADSATLTSSFQAGGTVTYNLFSGSTCGGVGTVVGSPVTVTGGVIPNSASQTFNSAGPFSWNAAYSGDSNNNGATSSCEPLTVNKVSPTLTTSLSGTPINAGGSVADTATLSSGFQAGGTVTYRFFTGSTCGGTGTQVGTPVTATNGIIPNSAAQVFAAGSFSWNAAYSGDANNNAATSPCEPMAVGKASPTIATTLSSNSIPAGDSVTDSAVLSSGFQAGGTVTYNFFAGSTCSGTGTTVGSPVTVTNGAVPNSASQTFATAGSFSWNAVYSGDANNNGATSPCEPLSVTSVTVVTVSTSLSSTSIPVGGSVTDSATLSGVTSTAGGTVTYNFFTGSTCGGTGTAVGSPVTVTNGIVPNSAAQSFNTAGSFSWNAVYSGDANNAGAVSACEPLTVNQAAPTVTTTVSSANVPVGTSVHDSATLSGGFNAGGSLTYTLFSNSGCTGTGTVISTATVTGGVVPDSSSTMPVPAGSYSFQASYGGDTNNKAAISACEPFTVAKATPTIATTLSATQINAGGSVTDSATLIGGFQAGGTVTYNLFSSSGCTGSSTIVSTVNVSNGVVPNSAAQVFNNAGSFSWNAAYSGDANNVGVTSSCELLTASPLTTAAITTTLSANSITVGGSVFDTAKLTGVTSNAGGTVTYTVYNGTSCGAGITVGSPVSVTNGIVPNSGPFTFTFVASFSWNAAYSGDANNNGATSPCELLAVTPASPSISTTLSATQITVGQSATDSATLTNSFHAGGFVVYSLFASSSCSGTSKIVSNVTVTNGVVPNSASQLFNVSGTFGWNALYSGDANNSGAASACELLTVSPTTTQKATLSFQAHDIDDCDNGVGQLTVTVNGHQVTNLPNNCSTLPGGTGDITSNTNAWISFGPFDITSFVIPGQNTIIFSSPPPGHFGLIRNVTVILAGIVLPHSIGVRFVSLNHPVTITFSNPPLILTSFIVSDSSPLVNQTVTFTATYTGGTAPFKCIFFFGDEDPATVPGSAGSCSVTHAYADDGNFTARVIVLGASTLDRATATLTVTVTDPPEAPLVLQTGSSSHEDVDDD